MKLGVFDKFVLFVLFNNIEAEVCEKTTSTKIECLGPCNDDATAWNSIYWCDKCCKTNSTWYCVSALTDPKCEATAQAVLTVPSTKRSTGSSTTTATPRPTRGVSSTTQRYFTYRPFAAYPKHITHDYDDQYLTTTSEPSK
ncbi:Hypothetical predicted protein [Mytilus galloprovincialis]|uniref:Uncharacterized protein n=1 Tax=Mytilus galloprovincialis TaxID=29158 RepID=A0A8B6BJE2_MYTGA|nr:Hypothetical predicted protein [Mytilus galloprovincialis]